MLDHLDRADVRELAIETPAPSPRVEYLALRDKYFLSERGCWRTNIDTRSELLSAGTQLLGVIAESLWDPVVARAQYERLTRSAFRHRGNGTWRYRLLEQRMDLDEQGMEFMDRVDQSQPLENQLLDVIALAGFERDAAAARCAHLKARHFAARDPIGWREHADGKRLPSVRASLLGIVADVRAHPAEAGRRFETLRLHQRNDNGTWQDEQGDATTFDQMLGLWATISVDPALGRQEYALCRARCYSEDRGLWIPLDTDEPNDRQAFVDNQLIGVIIAALLARATSCEGAEAPAFLSFEHHP